MASLSKRERSVAAKFKRYERAKERASKFYDQADEILSELAKLMQPRGAKLRTVESKQGTVSHRWISRISDDQELHLVDNTAGDGIILDWGHAAVRRYTPKVVNL
jgi:hypothetical protein